MVYIHVHEVKLNDSLQQADENIINIIANLSSSTIPNLEAGDPTRNASLKIAELL